MKKFFFISMLIFIVSAPHAKALDPQVINFIISICQDNHGRQVDFVFHEDIQSYAYATWHQKSTRSNPIPVVHVNTKFFRWISAATQAFVLAHECGHQALGHIEMGGGSVPRIEFEADCYATQVLAKYNIIKSPQDILEIEKDFYQMNGGRPRPRSNTHPGTIERFDNINSCFSRYR